MSWGKGRVLPCPFSKIGKKFTDSQKKCPDLGKNVLFECIYGLNSHLKCSFKGILEKKHQNVSLWGPSFLFAHGMFILHGICPYSKKPSLS